MTDSDSLLEKAMSPDILDRCWRRLRNEHTPWSFQTSRDELQRHLFKHILECREDVLSGRYRPEPLRQFPMKKPDGRQRIISAQYLRDKLVQRALLTVLEPRAEKLFHNNSFAYRPGRNVAMALQKVREQVRIGRHWLVDADIRMFFDSIPHRPLKKILKSFIRDSKACELVERWLEEGAHHRSMMGTRRGISQGAILSPLFCNLYLHQFDMALSRVNIPFVRFADDFLLLTPNRATAENAMRYAEEQLLKLGLELHPEKSRVILSSPSVQFLGESLPNPSQVVPPEG